MHWVLGWQLLRGREVTGLILFLFCVMIWGGVSAGVMGIPLMRLLTLIGWLGRGNPSQEG